MHKKLYLLLIIVISEIFYPYILHFSGEKSLPFGTIYTIALTIGGIYGFIINKKYKFTLIDIFFIFIFYIGIIYSLITNDYIYANSGFKNNFRMIFVYFYARLINLSENDLDFFLKFVIFLTLSSALFSIYQYFFDYFSLIEKYSKSSLYLNPTYFGLGKNIWSVKRAYSFFLNWSTLAYYIMISATYLFSTIIIDYSNTHKIKINHILAISILIFSLILTYSRTVWVSLLSGYFIILIINNKILKFKFTFLLTLSSFLLLTILWFSLGDSGLNEIITNRFLSIFSTDTQISSGHYNFITSSLLLIISNPLGTGLGTAGIDALYWTESSIFKIMLEIGIIPGILLILIFILSIYYSIILHKNEEIYQKKKIFLFSTGIIVSYFIGGFVFPLWFSWCPSLIMWATMGTLINLKQNN